MFASWTNYDMNLSLTKATSPWKTMLSMIIVLQYALCVGYLTKKPRQWRRIRVGRCSDWSESSLGHRPFCWFWRAPAHLYESLQGSNWKPKQKQKNLEQTIIFLVRTRFFSRTKKIFLVRTRFFSRMNENISRTNENFSRTNENICRPNEIFCSNEREYFSSEREFFSNKR